MENEQKMFRLLLLDVFFLGAIYITKWTHVTEIFQRNSTSILSFALN